MKALPMYHVPANQPDHQYHLGSPIYQTKALPERQGIFFR